MLTLLINAELVDSSVPLDELDVRRSATTRRDNRKLRRARELDVPLSLLRGIAARVFVPVLPVYVAGDDPVARYVEIAVDESLRFLPTRSSEDARRYADRFMRLRLHQPVFRA
jgi:putative restriction endonuclease